MLSKRLILIYGKFKDSFYRRLKDRKDRGGVLVLEGRPFLEGAKEVCRELLKLNITPTLICDGMAGFCFYQGMIKEVHLASPGIKSGKARCKIGSLGLAVCAKYHRIPVYLHPAEGKLPSRCRPKDIFYFAGKRVAPYGIKAYTALTDEVPLKYLTEVKRYGR